MIRILIVDDQKMFQEKLKALLAEVADFKIVGTASNGYEAITQVIKLKPDLVLMDLQIPILDGLQATEIICQQYQSIKVLILTINDQNELINKAIQAGATGYLLKDMSPQEILRAIRFTFPEQPQENSNKTPENLSINYPNSEQQTSSIQTQTLDHTSPGKITKISKNLPIVTANDFLPPISNWLIRGGLVCLIAFVGTIVIANFLKYKVSVKAPGIVRPMGELRIVQAATGGKIKQISAQENQLVQKGDIIAYIDDYLLQSKSKQLRGNLQQTKQQLWQLDTQIVSLKQQIVAEKKLQERTISSARARLRHQQRLYQEKLIATQAEVEEAEAAVELAQDELVRYQQLVGTGVVAQLQLKEKEATLKTALARLRRVKATLNPSSAEVEIAQEQIAQEEARGEATLARLNQQQEQLKERRIEIYNQINNYQEELQQIETELANTLIRVPISGTIQELNLRNQDQVVSPGDNIATIAPIDASLEIKAFVPSKDISKVETGQTTQMRVSACPYPDFGTLVGTVIAISPDTINSQSQTEDISSANSSYEISIKPESLNLNSGSQSCAIQAGMEGQVDIISREETVLQFILRKAKIITKTTTATWNTRKLRRARNWRIFQSQQSSL